MNNRHVSIDKDTSQGYVIRFWDNGEFMHIVYCMSVENYAATIEEWLDGKDFSV